MSTVETLNEKIDWQNRKIELLARALNEIAQGSCCGEFVGGCPVNSMHGDTKAHCARTKAARAMGAMP